MTEWSVFVGNGPNTLATDVPITLGIEFFVTQPNLYLKAVRFYKGDVGITGSPVGRTSRIDGPAPANTPLAGSDIAFGSINAEPIGWVRRNLASPIALVQNQHYKSYIFMPTNYTATAGYWVPAGAGAAGLVNGPVSAPNSAGSQDGQCSYKTGASISYPDTTFNGGNFWIDVVITDTLGGSGMGQSVQDIARQRMLTQLSLVEPQGLSNADLMVKTLAFGGQTVITKTDATAAVHLWRLYKNIANGG